MSHEIFQHFLWMLLKVFYFFIYFFLFYFILFIYLFFIIYLFLFLQISGRAAWSPRE